MRHCLHIFPENFIEMPKHGSLLEKLQSFGQIDDFSCFLTKRGTFFFKLHRNAKHGRFFEKLQVLTKSMISRAFSGNEALVATFF